MMATSLPNPTLVIGLGGTGQWIACHVLKELMDLYGLNDPNDLLTSPRLGRRVRILAIDTDQGNLAKVRRHVQVPGMRIGDVRLPDPMRLPLGAQIMSYVQQVVNGRYPWISSWFDARWFLSQPVAADLLNLTYGAAQFRPLGRIAVPYNLTEAGGGIRNALTAAIDGLKHNMQAGESLIVCLAGSLCGGTGAGMVADIAHLVQVIAGNTPVNTRAYLVLPGAFEGTVPPAPDGGVAIRQRAFAAMRELHRLTRHIDHEIGYPMYYAGPHTGHDELLRGRVRRGLFESLYYFDAGLRRADGSSAPVHDGVAPLIAEAILLSVGGQASPYVLSHNANLTAIKAVKVANGLLHPQATVVGGMGAFSLYLPIEEIIATWTCHLAREAIREFLGVSEHEGEDVTAKTVVQLRNDWAGGQSGIPGRQAALMEWERGAVGDAGVGVFVRDVLTAGRACREDPEARERRTVELRRRMSSEWELVSQPRHGVTSEEQVLAAEFLYPPTRVVGRGGPFNRPTTVLRAEVTSTDQLSDNLRRAGERNPQVAAKQVIRGVDAYLDSYLGQVDPATEARGCSDEKPAGRYPSMLRRWCEAHVSEYRQLLRTWIAFSLNGTAELQRTVLETTESALQNRAGKLGYTLALLEELRAMLHEAEQMYRTLEREKLDAAVAGRFSSQASNFAEAMERDTSKQKEYLAEQQRVLDTEREYACIRATRLATGEMSTFTQQALASLRQWEQSLCKDKGLYQAVWQAQEQVATSLALLKDLSAVREVIDVPETKKKRYRHYAEQQQNALGETLNALRWQVKVEDVYDSAQAALVPTLTVGLSLGDELLSSEGPDRNRTLYLGFCRRFFESAREHETALTWLSDYYDDTSDKRSIEVLATKLARNGGLALQLLPGANPYRFAYVRSLWLSEYERSWHHNLLTSIVREMGADAAHSQLVDATDPYRLTLLTFGELVDIEKLSAYQEGINNYLRLPARTEGSNLSRQLLHVFAAERNAAVYEEQLGRLLPDRIVALLEEPERFRQFVHAWAYGLSKSANGAETLVHRHRVERGTDPHAGQWVYRLTAGPFENDLDPITLLPRPAEHRWLCEPVAQETLSLFTAAETFCLRGVDRWQAVGQLDEGILIDYDRVQRSINVRRQALLNQPDIGSKMSNLKTIVDGISNENLREQAVLKLAELEYFQRLLTDVIPSLWRGGGGSANLGNVGGQDANQDAKEKLSQAEKLTFGQLDPDLYDLMGLVIADELKSLMRNIQDYRSA